MKINVVTLMPELIRGALEKGVIGQALKDGRWQLETVNPREFTTDVHHTVDDKVFGGGDGMLLMAEPIARSIEKVRSLTPDTKVIHLSPRGRKFDDATARAWAAEGRALTFIASRYAGVDARVLEEFQIEEISIGDFVVSGGDLPAALVIDAILRHLPGVLGNAASAVDDSFAEGVFESAQYTRPREWRGRGIPAALASGDPVIVGDWQFLESLLKTLEDRGDLIAALTEKRRREISKRLTAIEARLAKEPKSVDQADEKPALKMRREAAHEARELIVKVRKMWSDRE